MKNKFTAQMLALFLGSIGIHKFYLDRPGQGLLYLLFFWTLVPGVLACADFLILCFQSEWNFNTKYNRRYM